MKQSTVLLLAAAAVAGFYFYRRSNPITVITQPGVYTMPDGTVVNTKPGDYFDEKGMLHVV